MGSEQTSVMHLSILRPIRDTGGVGINRDLHMNFDPRGGAFDLSPHNLCHEVRMAAKKVLVSWQSLGEPERSRVVKEGKKYVFLMYSEGRKFTCRCIFLSSLFL